MDRSLGDRDRLQDIWEFPIDDFVVLARPDIRGLYILNRSACLIWGGLKARAQFRDLVDKFVSTFGISPELAAEDIEQTLNGWRSDLLSAPRSSTASPSDTSPPSTRGDDFLVRNFLVHGKSIRICLQTSDIADEILPRLTSLPLAPALPDFTFRVIENPDGFSVFCGSRLVSREQFVTEARSVLLQEVVRRSREVDDFAIFHAGACGSDSRCVIFPAQTQSGKSTLAAVLMQKGLTFYADDSVILERNTLSVPPMPFGLMIREGSWDLLYPRFPNLKDAPIVSRYGQRVRFLPPADQNQGNRNAQVAAIVFVQFGPASELELRKLDTLEVLLRLQESGFWVAHDKPSISAFLQWLEATSTYFLNYSDVDQAAAVIQTLL